MDPALKTKTIEALKRQAGHLAPRLKLVAKYIVDHPLDFGLDSIRETARKCGVSTYTLVRLAEQLGFSGYEELREPFRHALVSSTHLAERPAWIESVQMAGPLGPTQAEASLNAMGIVHRSLERLAPEDLERAVALMLGARRVYLTAVRSTYALAYYFHYVGRMALPSLELIPRHMNSAIDDLSDADAQDVLVALTFTPYSREVVEACKFAERRGTKIILISDFDVISSEFTSAVTLIASVISTHHFGFYTGAMAVIDVLLAGLVKSGGEAARQRIQRYETLRQQNNAYWVAKKT
jgi:DNA-binding MurR/RpiR family transcriptional regulator